MPWPLLYNEGKNFQIELTLLRGDKPMFKNRRYAPRWNLHGSCVYRLDAKPTKFEGNTKNISSSGACIQTEQCLTVNQKIHLTLPLSEGSLIKVSGTVVWTRPVNYLNETGIHFYNASHEVQDSIVLHALQVNKEGVMNHWFDGWEK